jgi:hypothetical protein
MAQTHVLAAHLSNHGDLIADPDTPSDHLLTTFTVEAFEELWEPKGWVLVNRRGEAVPDLEQADPDRQDEFLGGEAATTDRAAARKAVAAKFQRSGKRPAASSNAAKEA